MDQYERGDIMICNLIKIIKNKINSKSKDFKITYIVPQHISNIDADARVGFVEHHLAKGNWGILAKTKRYNYIKKPNAMSIMEENTYMRAKYFYEFKLSGEYRNARGEIIRLLTSNLNVLNLSTIDNNNIFDLAFAIETPEGNTWVVLDFVKEKEVWYLHGVNTRGW